MLFLKPCQNKIRVLFAQIWKKKKKKIWKNIDLSSQSSWGLAESSFEDPANKFFAEIRSFFTQDLKSMKKDMFFTDTNSLLMVHMDRSKEVLQTFRNTFGKYPKLLKKEYEVFKRTVSPEKSLYGHMKRSFDKPAEVFTLKTEKFSRSKSAYGEENFSFLHESVFLVKIFLRIWRMQFWHSRKKSKAKVSFFLCSKTKKVE